MERETTGDGLEATCGALNEAAQERLWKLTGALAAWYRPPAVNDGDRGRTEAS
ncbi:hypothetical protein [Sorangium sp. So ce1099]|uniref:hypothetical protein n=1 Tax=Sorangium sp. So ce1099 TaxID=3133331 RepID=UPI003F63788D